MWLINVLYITDAFLLIRPLHLYKFLSTDHRSVNFFFLFTLEKEDVLFLLARHIYREERQRNSFHPLVHFPNDSNDQS